MFCGRSAPRKLGHFGLDGPANFSDGFQNGLGQLGNHVEFADLMKNVTENLGDRLRIQGRTVSRDSKQDKAASVQNSLKASKEVLYILFCGIVVEHFVDESAKGTVVYNG